MATYRNRLSKRQKRRSLKRKNVKSRKVMRGGDKASTLRNCVTANPSYEQKQALAKRLGLPITTPNPCKTHIIDNNNDTWK